MAIRATMDLSAIYESLLSISPDLSSDHGGTESSGLWNINSSDSIPSGGRSCGWVPPPPGFAPLAPHPGPELSPSPTLPTATPTTSSRHKTELHRTYSESGRCRYRAKCQFAHSHLKYKTELCHKFYLQGRCPYGSPCHFIHNPNEDLAAPGQPHPSPHHRLGTFHFPPLLSLLPPGPLSTPSTIWGPLGGLARSPSAHSLGSDPDDYASSGCSLGGSDSPVFEAGVFGPPLPPAPPRRLPIYNRISVSE
ncbi:hypothetical protein A6R68_23683 [Neotoma lepida]|uniref:mRNA decay activator protein ZFP36 n=1 Tax=Neotoma lepida TaxID=56216 RepID=A0A1A6HWF4_NEOLE|nr:hypothetical protein A6R68_23683 [Neotoma lepida]